MRGLVCFSLILAAGCADSEPVGPTPEPDPAPSPVGLWAVPRAQQEAINAQNEDKDEAPSYARPDPFYFDGQTVTIRILPTRVFDYSPKNDLYRLAAKMEGDTLYIRWPAGPGTWEALHTFRAGRYVEPGPDGEFEWVYERVPEGAADPDLELLRQPRPVYDYDNPPARIDPKWKGLFGPGQ